MASHIRKSAKKKPSKGLIAALVVVAIAAICGIAYWYTTYEVPHQEAAQEFNEAKDGLDQRNSELDAAIADLQDLQGSDTKPFDESTDDAASAAIAQAQAARQEAPDMPAGTDEIREAAQQIADMGDYTEQLAAIASAKQALQDSIDQMKQVTDPSEAFVVQRLTGLDNIAGVEAATEENDVNGLLHKSGGYTAAVFFDSGLVPSEDKFPTPGYTGIPAVGTDGGGCVEVYEDVDGAQQRDQYLASYDGSGILNPGSHTVVGTCVVRTSRYLTASQQNALTQEITDSLTRLS